MVEALKETVGKRMAEPKTRTHGRIVSRTLRVVPFETEGWAGIKSAWMLVRRTWNERGNDTKEVIFGVTSLEDPDPQVVLNLIREHWHIENRLHWVRDVTLREDACRTRRGWAAINSASLNNLVLGLLRTAGCSNIQAGIDWVRARPSRAVALLEGRAGRHLKNWR